MRNIYCPTEHAILLAAIRDERGILRFPSTPEAPVPGLHLAVKPLIPIYEQLKAVASTALERDVARDLHIWDEFADEIPVGDAPATLYVATVENLPFPVAARWPVLPDLIRSLPKTKLRIPYLRAWQILQGGLKLNTKAVDPEELKKYFDD